MKLVAALLLQFAYFAYPEYTPWAAHLGTAVHLLFEPHRDLPGGPIRGGVARDQRGNGLAGNMDLA
jgi:hypothetical protein